MSSPTPKPGTCPICGLMADNAVVHIEHDVSTATYIDTEAHMWSVRWLAVP